MRTCFILYTSWVSFCVAPECFDTVVQRCCCCCRQLFAISWPPLSAHARCGAAAVARAPKRRGWAWAAAESRQQVEERWTLPQPQVRVERTKKVFLHDFRDFTRFYLAPERCVCVCVCVCVSGRGWRAVSTFKLKRRGYLFRSDSVCLAAFTEVSQPACDCCSLKRHVILLKVLRSPSFSPVMSFYSG